MGHCNTLNDQSYTVCVSNKTKELNLSVFNMITRINDSKILTKHTPNVNASLMLVNVTRIKSGIMINVGVSAKIQKNITHV